MGEIYRQIAEAATLVLEAVAGCHQVLGEEHPQTRSVVEDLQFMSDHPDAIRKLARTDH
jgi:hypothetical protein